MLKVMTSLSMMRCKWISTDGITRLGRRSSSLRSILPVATPGSKLLLGDSSSCSRSISDDVGKSMKRRMSHVCSKNVLSFRGGAKGTNADFRKELNSSSSSPSITNSNKKNSKINQRNKNSIGSRIYETSVGTEQGFRSYQEDEYYVSNDGDFAAVFDGHGGPAVSRYLRKNLYANVQAFLPLTVLQKQGDRLLLDNESDDVSVGDKLKAGKETPLSKSMPSSRRSKNPTLDDYANALESAIEKVDNEVNKISHWSFQGSTAIVIWLHEDHDERATDNDSSDSTIQRTILAANIGDSRAVLCRNNKAWDLSRDHKPNDPTEKSRIESLGGQVVWCGETDKFGDPIQDRGIYRVNGNLALSRAIGDRSERPHVSAEPEIISVPVRKGDEFVIVATDGLWDVMDSDDAVNYVKLSLKAGISKTKIADVLIQEAMRLGTYDNVTVIIIWIDPTSQGSED